MYIEVNNPNNYVRELLCKKFDGYDISDVESMSYIIDSFQYMYTFFSVIYEVILKVMYQDYLLERENRGNRYEEFKDKDELYYKIEEDPYFIIEMLREVFNFYQKSFLQKKQVFFDSNKKYIRNINELYSFDLLEYCRELTKEDLLCLFYNSVSKYKDYDEFDREFYAADDLEDFIFELYGVDLKNYANLSKQIIEEGYYFLKNRSTIEKLSDSDNKLLSLVENNKFIFLKELLVDDDLFLSDILYYFLEFNKLSVEQQTITKTKIKTKYCNLGDISCL